MRWTNLNYRYIFRSIIRTEHFSEAVVWTLWVLRDRGVISPTTFALRKRSGIFTWDLPYHKCICELHQMPCRLHDLTDEWRTYVYPRRQCWHSTPNWSNNTWLCSAVSACNACICHIFCIKINTVFIEGKITYVLRSTFVRDIVSGDNWIL